MKVYFRFGENPVEESMNVVESFGGKVYGFKCDLTDRQEVYRVAEETRKKVGDVTVLINNAGVASSYLLMDTPDHVIERTFDVNILAHFWTVKAFLPHMLRTNSGHIVTVASLAGHVGISKLIDYCSSKFAAVGFGEALRVELDALGADGVRTTTVCPYFIRSTGMFDNVDSRFLPRLDAGTVADRVVEAVRRRDQVELLVPGHVRGLLLLKQIVPWESTSIFLRALVPDANPDHPDKVEQCTKVSKNADKSDFAKKSLAYMGGCEDVSGKHL